MVDQIQRMIFLRNSEQLHCATSVSTFFFYFFFSYFFTLLENIKGADWIKLKITWANNSFIKTNEMTHRDASKDLFIFLQYCSALFIKYIWVYIEGEYSVFVWIIYGGGGGVKSAWLHHRTRDFIKLIVPHGIRFICLSSISYPMIHMLNSISYN